MAKLTDGRRIQFFMIEKRVFYNYNLNPYEFTVYSCIVMHVNRDKGLAWPGMSTIMKLTGIKSRPTVQKAIDKLESVGLLEVTRSNGKVNQYTLTCKTDIQVKPEPVNEIYTPPVNEIYTNNNNIEQDNIEEQKESDSSNDESTPPVPEPPKTKPPVKAKKKRKPTGCRLLSPRVYDEHGANPYLDLVASKLFGSTVLGDELIRNRTLAGRPSKILKVLKVYDERQPITVNEMASFLEWHIKEAARNNISAALAAGTVALSFDEYRQQQAKHQPAQPKTFKQIDYVEE